MDQVFGRNLRAIRVSQGLSQAALCEMAGISRFTLSKAEQGHRPRRLYLRAIADALGVEASDLEHVKGLRLVRDDRQEGAS